MYLDALVRVPQVKGKITFRTKGNTTYVEFENERVYLPEKKYTVEVTVTGLYSPNDKATILSVTVPHGEREQRCPISCLGRFKSIADQLKEGDRIAATVYVSVREADENHPFSQNLVCTDLYKFKEEEPEPAVEAAHATKEPEE